METTGGIPIQLSHFNALIKEQLADLFVENDEKDKATSYGLRCFSPTAADVLEFDWKDRVAAGGWAEANQGGQDQRNRMPWTYSGKRAERETLVKVLLARLLTQLQAILPEPTTWDAIRQWYLAEGGREAEFAT